MGVAHRFDTGFERRLFMTRAGAAAAGALLVLIRIFGIYPDGAPFAVLLASLGTPLFDLIRVAPYGKRR